MKKLNRSQGRVLISKGQQELQATAWEKIHEPSKGKTEWSADQFKNGLDLEFHDDGDSNDGELSDS